MCLALLISVAAAGPARAELVVLSTGRALSVRSAYIDADGTALLVLRAGGVVSCAAGLIARVAPDEVPYLDIAEIGDLGEPARVLAALLATPPGLAATRPFDGIVQQAARTHAVDANLVHAVIATESAYRPEARSIKGAMGLMQIMPGLARAYAVRRPYDPAANIEAGVRHLRSLLNRFSLPLALAAYNAGQGAVERFNGIPPFKETQHYVQRVIRAFNALGGHTAASTITQPQP